MTPEARKIMEERAAQWRTKVAANPELAKVTLKAAEDSLNKRNELRSKPVDPSEFMNCVPSTDK